MPNGNKKLSEFPSGFIAFSEPFNPSGLCCCVAMGTNLSKRNQWVKNKSENNNKLDLPQCLTCLNHDSELLGEVKDGMKFPPKRRICLAQLFLVCQARQCTVTAKLTDEVFKHFLLRVQLAVIYGEQSGNMQCIGEWLRKISLEWAVRESNNPNLVVLHIERHVWS